MTALASKTNSFTLFVLIACDNVIFYRKHGFKCIYAFDIICRFELWSFDVFSLRIIIYRLYSGFIVYIVLQKSKFRIYYVYIRQVLIYTHILHTSPTLSTYRLITHFFCFLVVLVFFFDISSSISKEIAIIGRIGTQRTIISITAPIRWWYVTLQKRVHSTYRHHSRNRQKNSFLVTHLIYCLRCSKWVVMAIPIEKNIRNIISFLLAFLSVSCHRSQIQFYKHAKEICMYTSTDIPLTKCQKHHRRRTRRRAQKKLQKAWQ